MGKKTAKAKEKIAQRKPSCNNCHFKKINKCQHDIGVCNYYLNNKYCTPYALGQYFFGIYTIRQHNGVTFDVPYPRCIVTYTVSSMTLKNDGTWKIRLSDSLFGGVKDYTQNEIQTYLNEHTLFMDCYLADIKYNNLEAQFVEIYGNNPEIMSFVKKNSIPI